MRRTSAGIGTARPYQHTPARRRLVYGSRVLLPPAEVLQMEALHEAPAAAPRFAWATAFLAAVLTWILVRR